MLIHTRRLSRRDLVAALAQTRDELRRSKRKLQDPRQENAIPREAVEPFVHHAAARDRFAFIHARRARFGVKQLCRAPVTDSSNYFAWVRTQSKHRVREHDEQRLAQLITEVHAAHPAYGALRLTRELQRQGVPIARRVVARLMRENGTAGGTWRRRRNLPSPTAAPPQSRI